MKARADAHGVAQLDLSKRLKEAEGQLAEARAAAATACEDATHLRDQAGTLEKQNAELMQALKLREGRWKSSP